MSSSHRWERPKCHGRHLWEVLNILEKIKLRWPIGHALILRENSNYLTATVCHESVSFICINLFCEQTFSCMNINKSNYSIGLSSLIQIWILY